MTTFGHVLLALALLLSWINSAVHVWLSDRPLYMGPRRMLAGDKRVRRGLLLVPPSLVFALLVVLFATRYWPEPVAAVLLAMMAGIRRLEVMQWESDIVVRLGKYVPGAACLLAWLVADLVLRACGEAAEVARTQAWSASCGVVGGAYVLAGIAKLRESGLVWAHPRYQSLLIAERGYSGPAWVRRLRLAVARSRRASWVVGVSGIAIEFLAAAIIVPVLRWPTVGLVLLVHLGFTVMLGYFEPEWILSIVAVVALAGAGG